MEEKLKASADRYRENLRLIQVRKRKTILLNNDYEEHLTKKGKQINYKVTPKEHNSTTTAATAVSTTQQQQRPEQASHAQLDQEVQPIFIYPKGRGGYAVYARDIARLEGIFYLNDTIINVCLAWVAANANAKEHIRVVDSQWFSQLTRDLSVNTPSNEQLIKNAQRLQRWFPKGHPFDKGLVAIPICINQHWMTAICLQLEDKLVISVLNSLEPHSKSGVERILKDALAYYHPTVNIAIIPTTTQQQTNMYDCGVHTIENTLKFIGKITNNKTSAWDDLETFLLDRTTALTRSTLKQWITAIGQDTPVPTEVAQLIAGGSKKQNILLEDLALSDSDDETEEHVRLVPGQEVLLDQGWTLLNKQSDIMFLSKTEVDLILAEVDKAKAVLQQGTNKRVRSRRDFSFGKLVYRIKRDDKYCKLYIH